MQQKQPPSVRVNKAKNSITVSAHLLGSKEIIQISLNPAGKIIPQFDKQHCLANPPHKSIMTICYDRADLQESWSWDDGLRDWHVNPSHNSKISQFHTMYHGKKTWKEISDEKRPWRGTSSQKHCSYSVSKIVTEAQKRLLYLGLDEFESIYRFRLDNKFRFYGFNSGSVFLAIWHDPNHNIYPYDP